ncbi:MAG: hypothetical protein ACK4YT_13630, partial [Sphingomonas sp.]
MDADLERELQPDPMDFEKEEDEPADAQKGEDGLDYDEVFDDDESDVEVGANASAYMVRSARALLPGFRPRTPLACVADDHACLAACQLPES